MNTVALPTAVYAAGTHSVGPVPIPDGITSFLCAVARDTSADPTIWPNTADTISIQWQVSLDGGVTWNDLSGLSAGGGPLTGKNGEIATSTCGADFPLGTSRLVRVTAILSADIKTSVTISVT